MDPSDCWLESDCTDSWIVEWIRVILGAGTERLRTQTVLGSLEMKHVGLGLTSGFSFVRFNRGKERISRFEF